jgi:hypothetical protein
VEQYCWLVALPWRFLQYIAERSDWAKLSLLLCTTIEIRCTRST